MIRANANTAIGDSVYRSISPNERSGELIVAVAVMYPGDTREGGGGVYNMPVLLILALATTVGGKI